MRNPPLVDLFQTLCSEMNAGFLNFFFKMGSGNQIPSPPVSGVDTVFSNC